MKTDGGHEVDEKDLEEMGMAAGEEPKTSNTSLEEYTGTCKFCGQMGTANGEAGLSEAEVNELITCHCGCEIDSEMADTINVKAERADSESQSQDCGNIRTGSRRKGTG